MSTLLNAIQDSLYQAPTYPGGDGRGIVIVGGGSYLPSAYIAIRHLRAHGCEMPLQLWYLGAPEIPPFFRPLVEPLHVQLVDALAAPGAGAFRTMGGWECKIHAIMGCPFAQVLLLDADNIPLFDPSLVFECEQFRRYGQIFWPDFFYPPNHQFAIRPRAWKELGLPPRSGLELESGQIVVDRRACWRELQIVRAFNLDLAHCHRLLTWGDKDTFTLGWLLSQRSYCTVPLRPQFLRPKFSSMLWQHWFDGRRLFQHQRKWIHPPQRMRRQLLEEELLKEQSLRFLEEFWDAAGNKPFWRGASGGHSAAGLTAPPTLADVNELARQGRLIEADLVCRQRLEAIPDDAQSWHMLGMLAGELGSFSEAPSALLRAVELAPRRVQYRLDLAAALCNVNRPAEAIPHLLQALPQGAEPAKVQGSFGMVLEQLGQYQEAAAAYRNALNLQPTSVAAHDKLATVLRKASDPAGSIQVFERSLALKRDPVTAYQGITLAAEELGDSNRAIATLRKLVELRPRSPALRSWLLYNLHYDPQMDPSALYQEHAEWERLFGQPLRPFWQCHRRKKAWEERIRIGYVSPDFREHTVPRFIGAALKHHDRSRFEIYCYSDVSEGDATTRRLRGQVEHWRDIAGLDDQRVHQIIADDQIDILVDLRGHAAGNRLTLFAGKPAPVQINMVGYFDTTGLAAMDYRLTDAYQDPPGQSERYHTEQLLRLGRSCWCYTADEDAPRLTPPPAERNGHITFGSLNKIIKVSEPCAALWAAVLKAAPGSKLALAVGSPAAGELVSQRLEQAGIPADRLTLLERTRTRREYLEHFGQIDVALDTFPFNGITTTCDSLWMGVPVVSLAGSTSVSRAGRSILHAIGLPQLAADSQASFVRAAVELAGEGDALRKLRLAMRDRMLASVLMDHVGFTRDLESAYGEMWNRWQGGDTAGEET